MVRKKPTPSPRATRKWVDLFVLLSTVLLIAVLVNMALIFFFSSESKEESGNRSTGIMEKIIYFLHPDYDELDYLSRLRISLSVHRFVRKMAHFLEFGLLGLLSTGLVLYVNRRKRWVKPWLEWCIPPVFCFLYAVSDEVHQIFSNRGPSFKDVLIDFAGALTGILVMRAAVGMVRAAKRRRERRRCKTPATD